MSVYKSRLTYKPFDEEWAFLTWERHEKLHWLVDDIRLDQDVRDYSNMSEGGKLFVNKLMLMFTQMDVDVGDYYLRYVANRFELPELKMMFSGFAAREAIHENAYSIFSDTLGLGDKAFTDFMNIPELKAKHDLFVYWMDRIDAWDISDKAKDFLKISIYSGFGEGVSLFSSFGMLLSLAMPNVNIMPGLATIVNYSIRDERIHYEAMIELATRIYEEMDKFERNGCKEELLNFVDELYAVEVAFINYIFKDTDIKHITNKDVIDYVETILNRRYKALTGIDTIFAYVDGRSSVIDDFIVLNNGDMHENFFEVRATNYTKGGVDMTHVEEIMF